MHIIIAIIGIMTALTVWYWRAQILRQGAREAADALKTAANLPRRLAFLRKSGKQGLSLISDPRDAAAIIMIEVAGVDDPINHDQRSAMLSQLTQVMGMGSAEAEELIVNAEWLVRDIPSANKTVSAMTSVLRQSEMIGLPELTELDHALVMVASADGPTSSNQTDLIELFREKANLV